jgi:predicted nucleic acid-binding protein
MNRLVVFDTCVLIDQLREDKFRERMLSLNGRARNSSVVLAELWRGATTKTDFDALRAIEKHHKILTPTEKNWIESGHILANIRVDTGYTPQKLRDLHFDVLIALTVRSHGATLITSNRTDFEMISSYRSIQLEFW